MLTFYICNTFMSSITLPQTVLDRHHDRISDDLNFDSVDFAGGNFSFARRCLAKLFLLTGTI